MPANGETVTIATKTNLLADVSLGLLKRSAALAGNPEQVKGRAILSSFFSSLKKKGCKSVWMLLYIWKVSWQNAINAIKKKLSIKATSVYNYKIMPLEKDITFICSGVFLKLFIVS